MPLTQVLSRSQAPSHSIRLWIGAVAVATPTLFAFPDERLWSVEGRMWLSCMAFNGLMVAALILTRSPLLSRIVGSLTVFSLISAGLCSLLIGSSAIDGRTACFAAVSALGAAFLFPQVQSRGKDDRGGDPIDF